MPFWPSNNFQREIKVVLIQKFKNHTIFKSQFKLIKNRYEIRCEFSVRCIRRLRSVWKKAYPELREVTKRVSKMFKFLNQCFARLRFWKSVSSKTAVAPSSRFCEIKTLFQNRSCAKHWFKNLNILALWSIKMFCASSNFMSQPKNLTAFSAYSKT